MASQSLEARRHRLLHQHVDARLHRGDCGRRVERMRRADHDRLGAGLGEHRPHVREGMRAVQRRERLGTLALGIAGGDELRLGQTQKSRRVDLPDLAAANQRGSQSIHLTAPENTWRPSPAGKPASEPSRPCRSSHPRC